VSVKRPWAALLPGLTVRSSYPPLGSGLIGARGRQRAWQFCLCVMLCAAPVLLVARLGMTLTLFVALLAIAAAVAVASPVAFAVTVLAMAPLPDVGALVGVSVPVGFDPVTLLVAVGAGMALQRGVSFPFRNEPVLVWLTCLGLGLLAISWFRTYGQAAATASSLALLVKPAIIVAGGVLAVQMLPRTRLEETLACALGAILLVIGLSVALQRLGLYTTVAQEANAEKLQLKQYGGVMISGNDAGAIVSVFTLPAFVLLRSVGRPMLAATVLLASVPVLLITMARASMIALVCGLAALAVLDRRAARGARVALGVVGAAAIWTATIGRPQVDILVTNLQSTSGDANATLSGRSVIWDEVPRFLQQADHGWLVGGGLDSFKTYAETALGNAFATHNAYFADLTNGGAIMLVAAVALLVAMWNAAGRAKESVRVALRTALISIAVLGLSANVDVFTRSAAWIWPLAAAAVIMRRSVDLIPPARAARPRRTAPPCD
jgi:O-Antigen ligase